MLIIDEFPFLAKVNPSIKSILQQIYVDITNSPSVGKVCSLRGIFVECKFRNGPMAMDEYDDLVTATEAFTGVKERKLMFISKRGFTEAVRRRAGEEEAELVELRELFG